MYTVTVEINAGTGAGAGAGAGAGGVGEGTRQVLRSYSDFLRLKDSLPPVLVSRVAAPFPPKEGVTSSISLFGWGAKSGKGVDLAKRAAQLDAWMRGLCADQTSWVMFAELERELRVFVREGDPSGDRGSSKG